MACSRKTRKGDRVKMKAEWSKHWKASKQPRKQRKYKYNLPAHLLPKLLSSTLSPELRKKYTKRNVPVHAGDTVKVMRGQFKGKTGKVERVLPYYQRLHIAGVVQLKKDGSKVPYPAHPSKVRITELNLDDKKRAETLQRK